jgi:hypothetical protein
MTSASSDPGYGYTYQYVKDSGDVYSTGKGTSYFAGLGTDWDSMAIEEMVRALTNLRDGQYTTAAAQWRRLGTQLQGMLTQTQGAANTLLPQWDPAKSQAAAAFFDRIGGTTFSLAQWAETATANASALDRVATALVTARTALQGIYTQFLAEYNANIDQANAYANGAPLPKLTFPSRAPESVRRNAYVNSAKDAANAARRKYTAQAAKVMQDLAVVYRTSSVGLVEGFTFQGPKAVAKPTVSFPGAGRAGGAGSPGAAAMAAAAAAAARLRQRQAALAAQQAVVLRRLAARRAAAQAQLAAQQQFADQQAAAQGQLLAAQQQLAAAQAAAMQQLTAQQTTRQLARQAARQQFFGRPLTPGQLLAAGPGRPGLPPGSSPNSLGVDPASAAAGSGGAGLGSLRQFPPGTGPGEGLRSANPGLRGPGQGSAGYSGLRGRLAAGARGGVPPSGQPPLSGRREQRDAVAENDVRGPVTIRPEREDYLGDLPTVGTPPTGRLLADGFTPAAATPPPDLTGRDPSGPGPGGAARRRHQRRSAELSGRRRPQAAQAEDVLAPDTVVPPDLTGRRGLPEVDWRRVAGPELGADAELLGIRTGEQRPDHHASARAATSTAPASADANVAAETESLWTVHAPESLDAPVQQTRAGARRGEVLRPG